MRKSPAFHNVCILQLVPHRGWRLLVAVHPVQQAICNAAPALQAAASVPDTALLML